ncbi:MAG: Rrf2 family transcriptional regulator [Bacteroidales bacterium]|nr:Rrf2 family transcriptional regulator [Bacteroidales bacterium]
MAKIFSLSEAASIAIHSMVIIAQSEKSVNVNAIAERTGSSKHHVAKILQRLVKEDYLTSVRGPHGGFQLVKEPEEITLLEIYETIEGHLSVSECPMENPVCPFNKCIMGNIVMEMTTKFREYLRENTIDQFLEKK